MAKKLGEDKPLLPRQSIRVLQRRYCNASKCIKSKAALLALTLNFAVHIFYYTFISPTHFYSVQPELLSILVNIGFSTLLRFTYPLAGYLADNKFGRYKTVFSSLKILQPGIVIIVIGGALVVVNVLFSDRMIREVQVVLTIIGSLLAFIGFLLLIFGIIGFKANIIQFGLDQLFDSPWEDQVVFLYWFLWTSFCPRLIMHFVFKTARQVKQSNLFQYSAIGVAFTITLIFIIVLLCTARENKTWFFVNLSTLNPYKLVYLVTKFSRKHKVPVYRSALTYCEDEVPSGLDLGKTKYGGPFTTEQVEDVKVFYGILKVLLAIGPVFSLCYICSPMIFVLESHLKDVTYRISEDTATNNSTMNSLQKTGAILFDALDQIFVLLFIPFHLTFVRPFISYYTPGMLKKMGITMGVVLCAVIVLFVLDTLLHVQSKTLSCMFAIKITAANESTVNDSTTETPALARYFSYISVIHRTITNTSVVFIHVALYKFVCSQGPHSMKGLLVGVSYAIRAFFDLLGPLLGLLVGFTWHGGGFPSCGMVYYIFSIVLGSFSLLLYAYIARGYKYRVRDEPCYVRRYVEEYYYKYSRTLEDNFYT